MREDLVEPVVRVPQPPPYPPPLRPASPDHPPPGWPDNQIQDRSRSPRRPWQHEPQSLPWPSTSLVWLGSTFVGLSFQNRVVMEQWQVSCSLVKEDLLCVSSCRWCSIQIIHYLRHFILRHHEILSMGCVFCTCGDKEDRQDEISSWLSSLKKAGSWKNTCQLDADMMLMLSPRQAYRRLALLVHPDKCAAQRAVEAATFLCSSNVWGLDIASWAKLSEAFSILGDPDKRLRP